MYKRGEKSCVNSAIVSYVPQNVPITAQYRLQKRWCTAPDAASESLPESAIIWQTDFRTVNTVFAFPIWNRSFGYAEFLFARDLKIWDFRLVFIKKEVL